MYQGHSYRQIILKDCFVKMTVIKCCHCFLFILNIFEPPVLFSQPKQSTNKAAKLSLQLHLISHPPQPSVTPSSKYLNTELSWWLLPHSQQHFNTLLHIIHSPLDIRGSMFSPYFSNRVTREAMQVSVLFVPNSFLI